MELEKTTHMNLLLEFYSSLLTPKQLIYMERYYAEDYSLGEIAEEFDVSRQAIYDNIKRSSKILENYEKKLHLVSDFYKRQEVYDALEFYCQTHYEQDSALQDFILKLQDINK